MKNLMFFILLFSMLSCNKIARITSVSGTVIDYGSGEPIENVKIHLKDGWDGSSPFTDADYTTDAEAIEYTKQDGTFSIEIEGQYNAFLFPSHPDYWVYDLGETAVTNQANGYNKGSDTVGEVIELKAKAWYRGSIIPIEYTDTIIFVGLTEDFSRKAYEKLRINQSFYYPNESGEDLAIGNTFYKYSLKYKRNNQWYEIIDSVYIKKLETYQDTIYF